MQVRTHLRNMIIIPEMIGSVVGVYNGKTFNQVRTNQTIGYSNACAILTACARLDVLVWMRLVAAPAGVLNTRCCLPPACPVPLRCIIHVCCPHPAAG